MPHNWKTYKLNDIAEILNSKRIPLNSRERSIRKGNIPYYGASGIVDYIDAYLFDGEHVLISEDGENLRSRNTPIAFKVDGKFWVNNHAHILKGKEKHFNDWIIYHFANLDLSPYLTGAVQPKLNKEALLSIPLKMPDFSEVKAIASILSALDDKIELNLQMNKTLEEMAMALYKHWFVDFGPFKDGEFVESELGMIPKGWEVKTLGEIVETIGGGTPKTNIPEYWENGDIDWYSPTDLTSTNSLFSLGSAKKISKLGLQKSSAKLLPKGSLLMSSRATIGALAITRKEACTNQGFISMIPNENISIYQLHGWTKFNAELILSKSNGSTFKEISKTEFRALPFIVGKDIDDYLKQTEVIYFQIENNILENKILIEKRNSLLPKLINGDKRISL